MGQIMHPLYTNLINANVKEKGRLRATYAQAVRWFGHRDVVGERMQDICAAFYLED